MSFTIPADHPSLPGHFPGRPLVPGVVVLDRVLEAIESRHGALPAGLRLPQVKFLQPLLPGEAARVELDVVEPVAAGAVAADTPSRWRFRVLRGDVLLASGEVVAGHGATP
ncbi:dehydratase [Lysobacter arseniciresistens ZS79]|uniref:Dehydratase n=1 Tax=Lysobacter arseniciresistens ZS79 TaxID=913325 RepID=A0A0A0F0J5_9GAMM|nr:dehydratase [Lysobacter arseniciresistens]KGM54922.1 dehydratase [Lysobacter arseniciresistens ZS79]